MFLVKAEDIRAADSTGENGCTPLSTAQSKDSTIRCTFIGIFAPYPALLKRKNYAFS
jgi:hypothetical protein